MRAEFWFASLKGSDNSGDVGIGDMIILKWVLRKYLYMVLGLDLFF